MDKRGTSLGDLYPAVITIVLIGIMIGLGIFILTSTSDAISTETITVYNETLASGLTEAGSTLTTISDCGAHDFVVAYVYNGTTADLMVVDTDYTTSTEGSITGVAGSVYLNGSINATYSYTGTGDTSSTGTCGVLETTGTGVGGMAAWIAVIVVVLAAAVVLGIVVSSFGNRGASV